VIGLGLQPAFMELESALEIVRRHRGPVTQIGLRKGDELYYILESTGERRIPRVKAK
jgi:hypothetical protein